MQAVFKSRAYQRLWLNAAANALSMGGDFILVGWLALQVTGSTAWVGVAFAVFALPQLVFGVLSGSIADRFERFGLMRRLELLAAGLIFATALIFALTHAGKGHILLLPLVLGGLRAVQNPIRLTFAYDLAGPERARSALAGINLGGRAGMIPGALLVGFLADRAGVEAGLAFMGAAHLVAFFALGRAAPEDTAQTLDLSPPFKNLRDSLQELRRNGALLALVAMTASVEVFAISFITLLPSLAETQLDSPVAGLGQMNAMQAVGGLIAGFLLFVLPVRRRGVAGYALSIMTLGAAIATLGWVEDAVFLFLTLALLSAMIVVWDILTQSMMQLSVSNHLRGRIMGVWVFAIGMAPLGHLEIGLLAREIGVSGALYVNGTAVVLLVVLFLSLVPSLRRLGR